MHRSIALIAATAVLVVAGCSTTPTTATKMDSKIRAQVDKGIIEPGFTPEMVFLALGKPSEPSESLSDATTNGTWVYNEFTGTNRDFIRAGFRQRVVFDPKRKSDVVVTEPIDTKSIPNLRSNSLHVTFRDGRVVDIQRAAGI
jgi:hypothetical protein